MLSGNPSPLDNLPAVVCRPALPRDTPDVLELTRDIWEGEDYVPSAWPDWLADPHGRLAVAEYAGRVVGLSKLTRLAPGEWWLEGLRVHPEHEGRRIASRLHDYQLNYWLECCEGVLRLATASFRKPVQHLCERTGFERIGEFTPFSAASLEASSSGFHPLSAQDVAEAVEFARLSPTLELSSGLIDLGWKWASPSAEHFLQAVKHGNAWQRRERQVLLVIREDGGEEHEATASIQLVACRIEVLAELLADARRLAAACGYARLGWNAPLHPDLLPILEQAGFQRTWEASVYLYAKTHPVRP